MFEVGDRWKWSLHMKDVYFAPEIRRQDPGYDVVYYFFCREPHPGARKYMSAVIDLNREDEEILQSFRESTRKAVRRMLRDDQFSMAIEENLEENQLEQFLENYDAFTREKGFYPADRQRVRLLFQSRRLRLVTAYYQEELLAHRLLLEDTEKILPFYGYTPRLHAHEHEKLQLISRVSKTVDYRSMLYAKTRGKRWYDLGGLFYHPGDDQGTRVDHYKEGFHGEVISEYEFLYPLTWKGRLFCAYKKRRGRK